LADTQSPGDDPGYQLGRRPVLAGGLVRVDLLRDALVGVAEAVGDDFAVDAQVASERRVRVTDVCLPRMSSIACELDFDG